MTRTKKYKPWYNKSYHYNPSDINHNHYDPYLMPEYESQTIYESGIVDNEYFCYNCGGFAEFDDMEGTIHCKTCNAVAYPENVLM